MDRLTRHLETDYPLVIRANEFTWLCIYNRLAAYEDTGLEPEEIQEAVNLFADLHDVGIPKEIKSWVERCTWHCRKIAELTALTGGFDKTLELAKAYADGRCWIAPCNVGDEVRGEVVRLYNGHKMTINGKVTDIQTVIRVEYLDGIRHVDFLSSDFDKTVFLARAKSEKAVNESESEV